jgi:peroxiredoxin
MTDNKQLKTAPDFTAVDSGGRSIKLSENRGKNVMLVFNRGFQ